MRTLLRYQKYNVRFFALLAFGVSVGLGVSLCAAAAPTPQLTYHGKLTDINGVLVADGPYDFTLSIYDAPTGGNCLWTAKGDCTAKQAKSLTITKGIFYTTLGETGDNPLTLDFNQDYYLEIQIGTNAPMTPRRTVTTTGSAINAIRLNGKTADNYLTTTDNQIKSGTLTLQNNLTLNSTLTDKNNSTGTNGQILTSTATGVQWVNASSLGGGSSTFLGLADTPNTYTAGSVYFATTNGVSQDNANFFWDDTNKRLGIGTASPAEKLAINGNINFQTPIAAPTQPSATINPVTGNLNGTYTYRITYVDALGHQTEASSNSGTVSVVNQQVTVTVPVSPDARTVARRIYRAKAGATAGPWYFVATVNNNAATTYTDNIADTALPDTYAPTTNTTAGTLYTDGAMSFNATAGSTAAGIRALQNNGGVNASGFGYQALQNNTGGGASGFGYQALYGNTGVNASGFGMYALQNNTGSNATGIGAYALQNNTAASSSGLGAYALQNNTGDSVTGVGYFALRYNSGAASVGVGYSALLNNTGSSSAGLGHGALMYNIGNNANGFGYNALARNIGASAVGFGYQALDSNTGEGAVGLGNYALQNNTGTYAVGVGLYALNYNQGINNVAIGREAFNTFNQNTTGAKTFAPTAVDVNTDRITVTAHGFGANNAYVNLRFSTSGTAPAPLVTGTIYQFRIIDANTLEAVTGSQKRDLTGQGSGTHTLTPQYTFNNAVAIGYDAEPTASNQVMLGNAATTELVSGANGTVNLGSATRRWNTIYAANGTINTSDITQKKDIAALGYGLHDILRINPISFYWKDDTYGTNKKIGFSAQELQNIIPEVVSTGQDGTLGVYYADLIPVAFNAIKQQQSLITANTNNLTQQSTILHNVQDAITTTQNTLTTLQSTQAQQDTKIDTLAQIQKLQSDILTLKTDTANYHTIIDDLVLQLEQAQAGVDVLTAMSAQQTTDLASLLAINPDRMILRDVTVNPDNTTTLTNTVTLADLTVVADRVEAREVVAGKFLTAQSADAPTAGTSVLCRAGYVLDDDRKCVEDADATDASDGVTLVIPTKAVTEHSRILVTPHRAVAVGVTRVEAGKNFTVTVQGDGADDLTMDWMIVDVEK